MSKNGSKTPLIYALEPRLLFDGDLGADVASSIVYRDGNSTDAAPAVAPENQRENISLEFHSTRSAIVFIDGALEDTQTLAAAAPDHAEVHVLDGDSDGFAQINDILQNHDRVYEIHIFGHGMAGEARLGTASLSLETLTTHSGTLAALKDTLTEDGDILLYGCDIAVGEDGQTFIEELAELTAADIAASDNITGAGGDWELEVNTGLIEAETIEADEYASELGLTDPGNSNTYHAGIRYVESTSTKVMDNSSAYISNGQINVEEGGNGTTRNNNYYYVLLEKQDVAITGSSPVSRIDPDVTQDFGGNNNSGLVSNNSGNKGTPGVASFSTSTFGYTLSQLHNESTATVNSYLIFLNHNNQNNFKIGQVVFEEEILGVFLNTGNTHGYNNTVNNLYSSSQASYGSNNDSRVLESNNGGSYGAFFHADASTNVLNNGNDEFIISNYSGTNDRLQFKFSNGNGGDYIRVITRANSAPTVTSANDVSGSVTELSDGHADENTTNVTDTGYFTIADSNNDSVSVSVTSSSTTHSGGSVLGTLTPTVNNDTNDGSGQIDWTYAVADSDLDAMDAGESFTETFTLTVDDGNGGTVPQEVTVTINGAADPVLAAKNDFASVNEGESVTADALSGVLHTTDTSSQDTGTDLSVNGFRVGGVEGQGTYSHSSNGSLEGEYGTLTMQLDGAYSYVANSNISGLDAGEVVYDHFNYRAKDVHNNNDTAVLTITIVGQNEVIAQDDFASVNEGEGVTADTLSGVLHTTDTSSQDTGDNLSVQSFRTGNVEGQGTPQAVGQALAGAFGSLTLSYNGNFSYTANSAISNLGDGETVFDYFNYTAVDSFGNTDTAVLRISINGQNNAPTAADDTIVATSGTPEGGAVLDNDSDPDGTTPTVSAIETGSTVGGGTAGTVGTALTGTYGALTLNENGTYTYTVDADNADVLALGADDTPLTETFIYTITDGTETDTAIITVNVSGVNDAPVATDITVTVAEDKTTAGASLENASLIGPFDNTSAAGGYQTGYQTSSPFQMSFSPDGLKLIVASNQKLFTYTLTDAWDVDSWNSSVSEYNPQYQSGFVTGGVEFNEDGTTMFVSEYYVQHSTGLAFDGRLRSFDLSTAYDPLTAQLNSNSTTTIPDTSGSGRYLEPGDGRMDLEFSSDGLSMFILEQHKGDPFEHVFKKFTLSTAWDITTANMSNPTVYSFPDSNHGYHEVGFTFNGNGTRLFVLGVEPSAETASIREYSVPTPFDISNLSLVRERSLDSEWFHWALYDIALSDDESKLYLSGNGGGLTGGYIYQFSVADSVLLSDADPEGDTLTVTQIGSDAVGSGTTYEDGTTLDGQYGVLTIGADGTYRYVADGRAEDPLNAGDTATDSFSYTVSDGSATNTANLNITIYGANDAPTVTQITDTKTEDNAQYNIDLLTAANADDIDSADSVVMSGDATLTYQDKDSNTVALPNGAASATGSTLTIDPTVFDDLAAGESVTITASYNVTDGDAIVANTATITINGANDAPIVTAQTNVNETVTEFVNGDPNEDAGTHTISGSFDIADSDSSSFTLSYEGSVQWASEISTLNSTQTVGTFTLSDQTVGGTGSIDWTYSITDHLIADQVTANGEVSYLSLDGGESFAETFTITIDDGDGQTVTQDVVIAVNGANDFDAQDDFGVIEEGGLLSVLNGAEQLINNPITDASSVLDATFDGDENNRVDGVVFNNDGSQLYLLSSRTGKIQQHSLSTQFDVSTASSESTLYDGVNYSRGLVFSTDGEKAFTITPNDDLLYEYHLSTAFEIENMVLAETRPVSDGQGTNVRAKGLAFNSDGTKLYYIDQEGKQIIQEDLSSAFDITTASLAATLDISETQGNREWRDGFAISPDGRKMFATAGGNEIHEWILHTPDDITSATLLGVTNLGSAGYNLRGLAFSNDGSKLFFSNYTTGTSEDVVTRNTSVPFSVFYDELSHSGDVIDTNRSQTQDIGDNLAVASIRTGATEGAGAVGSLGTPLPGSYGSLTMHANGQYTYEADSNISNWGAGKIGYDQFNYTINQDGDPANGADHAVLTIKVVAPDDPPTVGTPAVDPDFNEDVDASAQDLVASGTITFADDLDNYLTITGAASATVTPANGVTLSSELETALESAISIIDNNNNTADWTLNVTDLDLDFLALDETITLEYEVTAEDDGGQIVSDTITLTITGTNDAPVAADDTSSAVVGSEFTGNVLDGTMSGLDNDVDNGDTENLRVSGVSGYGTAHAIANNTDATATITGTYGTLVLGSNGAVTYNPDQAAAAELTENDDPVTDTFTYTLADPSVETDTATVTFSVTSQAVSNTAPVASPITASASEDDTPITLDLVDPNAVSDPDNNVLSVTGTPSISATDGNGDFTLPDGTVSIDGNNLTVDPSLLNALDDGESVDILVTYDVSDGTTTTQNTATITVTGVNDAPVVAAITDTKTEDELSFVTDLTAGQTDPDGDTLSVTGTPSISATDGNGDFTLPDGTVSIDGNNLTVDPSLLNALDDGESVDILVTYDVSDGTTTTQNTATITVTGVNDAPVVAAITDTKTEDELSFVTDLTAGQTDPDGDTLSVTGTPSISATDGNGDFTLPDGTVSIDGNNLTVDPSLLNALDDGESVDILVTYDVSDGTTTTQNTATITVTGVNDAPVVAAITDTKTEDELSFVTDLTAGQTDPDGDTLSVTGTPSISATDGNGDFTLPDGTVSIDGNNLTVDPSLLNALDDGESVDILVTYDVSDGTTTTQNTATITITGVNDAPVVAAITDTKTEDELSFVTDLTAGQTDPDGDTLSVTGTPSISATDGNGDFTLPDGTVSIDGNNLTVDPSLLNALDDGESVDILVTYDVSDGTTTTQNTATITVTGVNDAPVVAAITDTKTEDELSFVTDLTAGQTDPDGDTLSVTGTPSISATDGNGDFTLPDGTVSIDGNNLTVDPSLLNALDDGESVDILVTYDVSDGTTTTQNTATITVTGVNDAPVVAAITDTKTEDELSFVTDLTAGQTDPDGDTLSVTGTPSISATDGNGDFTLPDGTVSIDGNNLTVDPSLLNALDDGESVDILVTYDVSDGTTTTQNTATITVTGVNDAPVVAAITDTKTEDELSFVTDLTAGQTDPDGDTLSVTGTQSISATDGNGDFTLPDGTVSIDGNNLTVDPSLLNALDDGESVDILVTYDVSDGTTTTQNTATITVTGVNDAPVVAAITDTKTEDELSFVTDLTAGQTDPDGDTLSVTGTPSISATDGNGDFTLPDGTVSIDGNNLTVDPSLLNALDDGESVDILVTYDVSDGTTTTQNTATITVTGVNDAPVVAAITDTKTEDELSFVTDLTAGQTDPDGDTLSVTGTQSISATDGNGDFTLPDGTVSIDGNNLTVDPSLLNALDDGESVDILVTYDVSDGTTTTQNTATITITGVNDAPTANDDSGNVVVGVQFASNVIDGNMGGQDTDPDTSDTLSVTAFATAGGAAGTVGDENGLPGQYGTLVLNSDGSLTYNADLQAGLDLVDGDAPVTDNFTYTISDSNGGTETATLSFSVTAAPPGNAAPVVSPIAITVTEDDTPFSTNLMVGQSDPNADPLSIMSDATFSAVDNGGARYPSSDATISLADNILTIDPTMLNELDDGESVDFTVTYNISDGQLSTQNTAIITVTGVNDAPVVAAITDAKTEEDAAFTIDLVGNQSDPDGELLSVSGIPTVTAVDANGTAFALPDNTASVTGDILTINPTLLNALGDGESVDILLTYDVSDGTVATQNTATIKISGINDAPVVAAITDTKTEDDASFVTDLTAGQNDPDGDTLSVTGTPTITATDGNGDFTLHNGTVSIDGNNLTIDPSLLNALDDGESVDILVTYDVSDGTTTTQNTAIITVTGVNDAPSADGNTISIAEDGLHNFTAAEFNFDDDDKNDTLAHITITSLPTAGSFTLNNADVSENQIIPADEIAGLVFTPDAGASAAAYASFGFTVNDGTADSVAAYTMTINVTEENDAPITVAITDTKTEDDAAFTTDLTLGQTDPEDDTLSVSDTPAISAAFANGDTVTLPANTVSVNGNILTVDPTLLNALGDGESVNITVTYDVSDGTATSPNTATITVTGLNDAPTSRGGNLELQGEQPINLSHDNFAFADVDKDALDKVTIVTAPQNGKLYLNDVELGDGAEIPAASINDLVYQPGAGASGSNYDAFIFSVNDGTDDSQNYTMSVGVNAAPTASDTPISLAEDTPFSGQLVATDMESGPLTYRVTRSPQHGTVALIGNGPNYIYTPDAHYYGSDSFTFEASDGALADTGNVTIDVTPENDRPIQRFLIPDITLMDGQAAKIFVAQAFAEIDALNPSLAGFNRSIDKLFSDGQFRNNTQLRNVPPSGQLTYSVSGLPDGMWLDNRNRICGVSTELGTFDVIVTATDGEGKSRNMTFKLSIAMPVIDRITDFQMGDTAKGEHETPKETPTEFSDHNMKPVLKIKPRKEGIVPDRFTAEAPPALAPDAAIGGSANATGLSGSSWMDTRVSTQQDVSGNIRVLDMEIKGEEIAVQIYDQAVDRAQRFKGEMADGKNLPDWITVDPLTGLTTAELPSNADAVEINVIAEDGSGNQRAINLIIDPKELMADNRPDAESTARQAREIVRSDTDVNVLGNGRVEFAEGLTASEGAMRLMRMVADTALVKIEIADSEKENDTRYEVRQTNGTAVPDWVQVNTQTGELTIEAPENVSGIELLLVATGNGEQRSIELDVNLDEMLDRGAADNTEPSTDNSGNASERDETGQFVPLDAQIEDALAGNNYGRDIQHALDGHA